MAKENDIKLEPTYGNFEVKGVISNMGAVEDGTSGAGNPYRKLNIQIEYAENSKITVGLFGMKRDEIEVVKFTGKSVERKTIKWAKRNDIPEGFQLSNFGSVGIGKDIKDGKTRGGLTYYVSLDALDHIVEAFQEGDSVQVAGSSSFSKSINKNNGQEQVFTNYNMSKIFKIDDIDFQDEEFKPYAKFDQNVVIVNTEKVGDFGEDKVNALLLDCIIITSKKGDFVNQEFVVLADKRPNLAKNLNKLKDYTLIQLKGNIVNKALVDETASDEDDGWGFDDQQKAVKGYERYFEVLAADNTQMEESKYTDDDFIEVDAIDEEEYIETKKPVKKSTKVEDEVEDEGVFDGEDDSEYLDDMDNWLNEEE